MQPNDEVLAFFSKLIEDEIGVVYRPDLYYQLNNRLETLQSLFGYKDLAALYEEARIGLPRDVHNHLIDLATNNETSFFRDKKVFSALQEKVLPELLAAKERLDIWSVASSSGQEAYSMAMVIEEINQSKRMNHNFSILATDICSHILERARSGIYSQLEVQRGLPAPLLVKYFRSVDEGKWQVSDSIKNKVDFKPLNLVDPFFLPQKFDLILCRNVLIYQNKERKQQILKRVDRYLNPGGFLVMGSGETLIGLREDYKQIIFDGAILYQKSFEEVLRESA